MTDPNHPLDLAATQAIVNAGRSATLRNVCFGAAALILGGGAAAASVIWAMHSGNSLAEIEAVLARTIIRTESTVSGTVAMKDGIVTLKDGATVGITGNLPVQQVPTVMPQVRQGPDAIKREVTVFSRVNLGPGESIHTGWNFASATDKTPKAQFCYHFKDDKTTNAGIRTELADDGQPLEKNRFKFPNFDQLLDQCQWFKPGDV